MRISSLFSLWAPFLMHKPLSLGPFTYSHKGEACMYSLCLVSSQPPGLVTSVPAQLPGVTPARVASQECSRGTRRSQGDHLRLLHQFHGSIACRTESRPGFSPRGQSVDGSWGRAPRKEGCWARWGLRAAELPKWLAHTGARTGLPRGEDSSAYMLGDVSLENLKKLR